jgi:hypothetical protein
VRPEGLGKFKNSPHRVSNPRSHVSTYVAHVLASLISMPGEHWTLEWSWTAGYFVIRVSCGHSRTSEWLAEVVKPLWKICDCTWYFQRKQHWLTVHIKILINLIRKLKKKEHLNILMFQHLIWNWSVNICTTHRRISNRQRQFMEWIGPNKDQRMCCSRGSFLK